MELAGELLKILLPSSLLLYGMYLMVQTFVKRDFNLLVTDNRMKNQQSIIELRLQAYERVVLLLERISPHTLVMRIQDPSMNVGALRYLLIQSVRDEFQHNLTQQLYISPQVWNAVRTASDQVIAFINQASEPLDPEASGFELAQAILSRLVEQQLDLTGDAILLVKYEAQSLF